MGNNILEITAKSLWNVIEKMETCFFLKVLYTIWITITLFVTMMPVTFVRSDNSKNYFISGKIQHDDFALTTWFVNSPVARSPGKLG